MSSGKGNKGHEWIRRIGLMFGGFLKECATEQVGGRVRQRGLCGNF